MADYALSTFLISYPLSSETCRQVAIVTMAIINTKKEVVSLGIKLGADCEAILVSLFQL